MTVQSPDASLMPHRSARNQAYLITGACCICLAIAMGIGRFAFTPLLPMMLHDGVVSLELGGWLATANYAGYVTGALACMVVPRKWAGSTIIRAGLAATILLTFGMALPLGEWWLLLRFLSGVASGFVFVFTAEWCLGRLVSLGAAPLGALAFTGPGVGITFSGLAAMAMVSAGWTAASGWAAMGLLALGLTVLVAMVIRGADPARPAASNDGAAVGKAPRRASLAELSIFTVAYGLSGFGYIITATFLPVMARIAMPGSAWLGLFWPILGLAVVTGCVLATRIPAGTDARLVLIGSYLAQAVGVLAADVMPNVAGFLISSLLVGLPFTVIGFFAMQDARRLQPHNAARFMGLLTGIYALGQIIGPPVTLAMLSLAEGDQSTGFAWSLYIAAGALIFGAFMLLAMMVIWPLHRAHKG